MPILSTSHHSPSSDFPPISLWGRTSDAQRFRVLGICFSQKIFNKIKIFNTELLFPNVITSICSVKCLFITPIDSFLLGCECMSEVEGKGWASFFHVILRHHLLKKIILPHWLTLASSTKNQLSRYYGPASGIFILLHWSICLTLYQYHPVFITVHA